MHAKLLGILYIYEASWANRGCRYLEVLDGGEQYRKWINQELKTDTLDKKCCFFFLGIQGSKIFASREVQFARYSEQQKPKSTFKFEIKRIPVCILPV